MTDTMETNSHPNNIPPLFRRRVCHSGPLGDSGQGLIELALTLPLLMLILLGAAEFARFAWASIETANAARAGVQYGAQNQISASDNPGMQTAALNDGVNLSGLIATPSHSCACASAPLAPVVCTPAPPALPSCASTDIIIEYVQVNTTSTITPLFRWPGLPTTFTANGSAIMEVQQP